MSQTLITNALVAPFKAIVRIISTWADGTRSVGTGALIDNNSVLTASHVVYNAKLGSAATKVEVNPAGQETSSNPMAYSAAKWFYSVVGNTDGTINNSQVGDDVAVVSLATSLGSTVGTFGMADTISQTNSTYAYQSGYGSDGTTTVSGKSVTYQGYSQGQIAKQTGTSNVWQMNSLTIAPGDSGSPVWTGSDSPTIVGVVSSGSDGEYFGAGITTSKLAWIRSNMLSDDSYIANGRDVVYRFFNKITGTHFYTASTSEAQSITSTNLDFRYEGQAFSAQSSGGSADVFRFFNTKTGTHFYTASATEKASVQQQHPEFRYEGVAYTATTQEAGGTALYRFFNHATGSHFYTVSVEERDVVIQTVGSSLHYEGVAYYVYG